MRTKLVSICTPCYNHAGYLDDYFKSIMNLDYREIELLIADDCSSDGSVQKILKWLPLLHKRCKRVVFIRHEKNLGVTKTCNELFRLAGGEFIKDMASDDLFLRNGIRLLVDSMEAHPNATLIIGNSCLIPDSYRYGSPYPSKRINNANQFNHMKSQHMELFKSNFVNICGCFFRREKFAALGFYDENLSFEDWDILLRISKRERIHFLEEAVCLYRASETSFQNYKSAENRQIQIHKFARMYRGTLDTISKNGKRLPPDRYRYYMKLHMVNFLCNAAQNKFPEEERIIRSDIENLGERLTPREKMRWFMMGRFPRIYHHSIQGIVDCKRIIKKGLALINPSWMEGRI